MSISTWGSSNMSRLPFASPRFFALLALVAAGTGSAALAAEACPGGKDLVLINGHVLTVDAADRTVSTVRIRGERILTVGEPVNRQERCTQIVDLGGRTVIPGLIDNHTHFVRTAQVYRRTGGRRFHQGAASGTGRCGAQGRAG